MLKLTSHSENVYRQHAGFRTPVQSFIIPWFLFFKALLNDGFVTYDTE